MRIKEKFVAYEYKNVHVTQDSAGMYVDCMGNFGWELVENDGYNIQEDLFSIQSPANLGRSIANAAQTYGETADAVPTFTLKFKRDRHMENKQQLEKLEREYEEALSAIKSMERRNNAQTMGVSLGTGIIGAVFIGLSVYNFISSNIILGVLLAAVGVIGWTIGFFSNRKIGNKKSAQSEPYVQEQLNIVYNVCEKAHALLV